MKKPTERLIAELTRMAELHPNQFWSFAVKEAAERLQEFKDIEDMLS